MMDELMMKARIAELLDKEADGAATADDLAEFEALTTALAELPVVATE